MRTRTISILVVLLLVGMLGAAQVPRGDIRGTVTDTSGAILPGVTVHLNGPVNRTTISDERGEYAFTGLLPGAYRLRFELAGFQSLERAATVPVDGLVRVDAALAVGSLTESVTVTSEAPTLEVSASASVASGDDLGFFGRHRGPLDTEAYAYLEENPFRRVSVDPLSTFSVDVDTASYANVRRFLTKGELPPPGAVRLEEMINYFRFDYPQPKGDTPFSVTTETAPCPWKPQHRLVLIGLDARDVPRDDNTPRNLVFLLDVSGSMEDEDKLPLVRSAMQMLVNTLTARDRVAIVVYAGASGLALPSTPGDQKDAINRRIESLETGGSTNGAEGITLAYQVAREHFISGGVNRVILATDGDFNVGVTSEDELVRLIEEQRKSGVFLSVLGVGEGNLKDATMEMLADKGNGNYAYLDSLQEARKVLVREAGATLVTVAKDVKIQVEFNPRTVAAYRLIGYENRVLRNEEFADDTKDAGEIGAGHTVTALYEIVPAGTKTEALDLPPLKYQRAPEIPPIDAANARYATELLTVKLRYKAPDGQSSKQIETVLRTRMREMTPNLGFASAVAEFGMLLRDSRHVGNGSFASAIERARKFRGNDPDGYRAEFITLAELAESLREAESSAARD